ncbi:MAG TPA: lipid-A-disaccharide synthase N-terminal domain-containing protein [Pseudomonadales bacterium]|nr:lipid-A-disaccharide synthase N-terminal domain-containing protein [Pseudomonadales bacterium]HNH19964.1 lipid-A-disaccharide synthase N-terminal domain-containing protein [Pseudomonadales bacterium]HNJ74614.1 lipid-A-disaccharide synthase N-terminal domain-containing protein [Pseudomonadales bacterium]HNL23586.1 lipid-A-disaccharide synthase N-terminal domain-containing protein [Pseudomonadales bacterium]HNL31380.1 lipid-A-disaccharide synthase N-terminal domain-containing protein [Pseudomo
MSIEAMLAPIIGFFHQSDPLWLLVGFAGQLLFSMRFIVQWLQSERVKRSVVPTAFWYFSVAGGATLLGYAIHRRDPVFILGQGIGLFIYFRNLQLIYRHGTADTDSLPATPGQHH